MMLLMSCDKDMINIIAISVLSIIKQMLLRSLELGTLHQKKD